MDKYLSIIVDNLNLDNERWHNAILYRKKEKNITYGSYCALFKLNKTQISSNVFLVL